MAREKGLLLVNTGSGKGKTTASPGMALRTWGQGMKVLGLIDRKPERLHLVLTGLYAPPEIVGRAGMVAEMRYLHPKGY